MQSNRIPIRGATLAVSVLLMACARVGPDDPADTATDVATPDTTYDARSDSPDIRLDAPGECRSTTGGPFAGDPCSASEVGLRKCIDDWACPTSPKTGFQVRIWCQRTGPSTYQWIHTEPFEEWPCSAEAGTK